MNTVDNSLFTETNFGNNDMPALPGVPNKRKIYMHQILDYMKMSSNNCFENLHQEYIVRIIPTVLRIRLLNVCIGHML